VAILPGNVIYLSAVLHIRIRFSPQIKIQSLNPSSGPGRQKRKLLFGRVGRPSSFSMECLEVLCVGVKRNIWLDLQIGICTPLYFRIIFLFTISWIRIPERDRLASVVPLYRPRLGHASL
jgi:hypothetical protein